MFGKVCVTCLLRFLALVATSLALFGPPARAQTLADAVAAARANSGAPGIGAVVVSCEGPIETAVSGLTRIDGTEKLNGEARFNIGSNAKSMLASLAATYVQEGRLRWTTTIGEILGSEAPQMNPALARATLRQLLSHRSGLPAFDSGAELRGVEVGPGTPSAQRLSFARRVLGRAPAYPVGSKFVYSNAGYVVAGVLLERVGGATFEQLMQERLFAPLGLHAVFGSPVPPAGGQPWGHYTSDGLQKPYEDSDPVIPPFLQPAGDVSLTLGDYGRYLREHLCGLTGKKTRLLAPAVVRVLHEPQGAEAAGMGWGRHDLGGTPSSVHVGGTGTFSAFVAVQPSRDRAVATVTNSGDARTSAAALALLQSLASGSAEQAGPARAIGGD